MDYKYEPLIYKDATFPFIFHPKCHYDYPPHWHESIEIWYIHEGSGDMILNSFRYRVAPNDIICINSEQTHYLLTPNKIHYSALIVHPSFLQKNKLSAESYLQPHIQSDEACRLYKNIYRESLDGKPYHEIAKNANIIQLLIYLYRNHQTQPLETSNISTRTEVVKKALAYIKLHYTEDISTADISRHLGFTANHLCHCFREETSTTIKKYINYLRCKDAEAMLSGGKYSITEVGMKCGFNNTAYFAKIYRSVIGISPSETQKKYLDEQLLSEAKLTKMMSKNKS